MNRIINLFIRTGFTVSKKKPINPLSRCKEKEIEWKDEREDEEGITPGWVSGANV